MGRVQAKPQAAGRGLSMVRFAIPLGAALLAVLGCQPAARYSPTADKVADAPQTATVQTPRPEKLSDELTWIDPKGRAQRNQVAIVFVHADKSPEEWERLDKFWTQANGPAQVASVIGTLSMSPIAGPTVVGPDPQVV